MSLSNASVFVGAIGLSVLVVWFFFFSRKQSRTVAQSEGVQEANIVVKGGYTPDVLVVKAGQPVRLNFLRKESASCSEMVVFADFDRSARLPENTVVPVEFTPEAPGEYDFQCQMGMFRGKLIVKDADGES